MKMVVNVYLQHIILRGIYCQALVQSQIHVQNPSPKSKVQRKRNGTGADNIILQATTPPHPPHPHLTFLTLNLTYRQV